ncbi:lymphatic vessel endothelial hyaluronic acid receptor 1 [Lepisosteus oculatus]|uniref:Lymphatic vessel endothelial hyaluronic acid receptor 1 n=1 Tax=Lepisosteus oculatus TaxID=7918 RepID=W5M859_LEPOC|nr:PREDICTED: lymphatic vessel endothelial hyaluronic acid receptor 1 [Lepisosteus oculatus]
MAKLCLISCLSLTLAMSALPQNPITKDGVQMTPSILGVYLYSVGQYSFNVTEARSACESLGVTIATKSQVSKARQNGLETCRYGWVDEQIAVIPRIKSLDKCGKNSTGLVVWRAEHSSKFDVFCFNSSDPLINVTSVTTQTSVTTGLTARETRSLTAQLPSMTSVSLKGPRSSTPPETQSPFLTTTLSSTLRSTTVSSDPLSQGLVQSPFTALPLALFVIAGILLLTAAAGAVWYCRRHKNVHPFSNKEPPKENIETEVWKQNNRDEQHQENQLETDLDKSRKNSQDLRLEVEPEAKAQ